MNQDKNQIYNKRDECLCGVAVAILHFAVFVFLLLTVINEVSQVKCVQRELAAMELKIYYLHLCNWETKSQKK